MQLVHAFIETLVTMILYSIAVISCIAYKLRWLMSNQYICVNRYIAEQTVVYPVYAVFRKHRDSIKPYTVYDDT